MTSELVKVFEKVVKIDAGKRAEHERATPRALTIIHINGLMIAYAQKEVEPYIENGVYTAKRFNEWEFAFNTFNKPVCAASGPNGRPILIIDEKCESYYSDELTRRKRYPTPMKEWAAATIVYALGTFIMICPEGCFYLEKHNGWLPFIGYDCKNPIVMPDDIFGSILYSKDGTQHILQPYQQTPDVMFMTQHIGGPFLFEKGFAFVSPSIGHCVLMFSLERGFVIHKAETPFSDSLHENFIAGANNDCMMISDAIYDAKRDQILFLQSNGIVTSLQPRYFRPGILFMDDIITLQDVAFVTQYNEAAGSLMKIVEEDRLRLLPRHGVIMEVDIPEPKAPRVEEFKKLYPYTWNVTYIGTLSIGTLCAISEEVFKKYPGLNISKIHPSNSTTDINWSINHTHELSFKDLETIKTVLNDQELVITSEAERYLTFQCVYPEVFTSVMMHEYLRYARKFIHPKIFLLRCKVENKTMTRAWWAWPSVENYEENCSSLAAITKEALPSARYQTRVKSQCAGFITGYIDRETGARIIDSHMEGEVSVMDWACDEDGRQEYLQELTDKKWGPDSNNQS